MSRQVSPCNLIVHCFVAQAHCVSVTLREPLRCTDLSTSNQADRSFAVQCAYVYRFAFNPCHQVHPVHLQATRPARCATRQVVRASGDGWYGPDRPKFLVRFAAGFSCDPRTHALYNRTIPCFTCRDPSQRVSPLTTLKESSPEVRSRCLTACLPLFAS